LAIWIKVKETRLPFHDLFPIVKARAAYLNQPHSTGRQMRQAIQRECVQPLRRAIPETRADPQLSQK
jgi:hypothetical protein